MNILSIPEQLIKEKELVLISRRKLDELLRLAKKSMKKITFSTNQKRALTKARKNKKAGRFLSFDELKTKLNLAN